MLPIKVVAVPAAASAADDDDDDDDSMLNTKNSQTSLLTLHFFLFLWYFTFKIFCGGRYSVLPTAV